MSFWPFALLETLHCDHVPVVCLKTEVTVIYVCEQMGFACALVKVSDVDVEMGTYDVVETDSCVADLSNDVVETLTYHDHCAASLLTHHEVVAILILTCTYVVVTFCFCLEMPTVQHELWLSQIFHGVSAILILACLSYVVTVTLTFRTIPHKNAFSTMPAISSTVWY